MDGGDRAGYKQIANVVDAIFIGPTDGTKTTYKSSDYNENGWSRIKVISSGAVFNYITAPGLERSTEITSGTTWVRGAEIECNQITRIKLSTKTTGHAVIAFDKVIL